jgi:hypothetical protein
MSPSCSASLAQSLASSANPSAADSNAATHHHGSPRVFANSCHARDTRRAALDVFVALIGDSTARPCSHAAM